jgi:hypothetical protein
MRSGCTRIVSRSERTSSSLTLGPGFTLNSFFESLTMIRPSLLILCDTCHTSLAQCWQLRILGEYMSPEDSSTSDRLQDYWIVTVEEDRAESAPPPAETEEGR